MHLQAVNNMFEVHQSYYTASDFDFLWLSILSLEWETYGIPFDYSTVTFSLLG